MASGRMEFHSESLMQHTNFSFVLPSDVPEEEVYKPEYFEREPKTVILLHGLTGTDTDWMFGGVAQDMAIQYNLNIFMPTTGNSFYLDKGYEGANSETFIAEELPEFIRKTFGVSTDREDMIIAGLSMGGYGAIHTALDHPEKYFACVALSSAFVINAVATDPRFGGSKEDATEGEAEVRELLPKQMIYDIFGDPKEIVGSDKDPEALFLKRKAEGREMPELYFAVGTEDSLLANNRKFRDFLKAQGADFTYEEGPGIHDWHFWNKYLPRGIEKVLG